MHQGKAASHNYTPRQAGEGRMGAGAAALLPAKRVPTAKIDTSKSPHNV